MEHQPPMVACEFSDADGRRHTVIDKVLVFSEEWLDAASHYPQDSAVRCAVLAAWSDATGREMVKISTANPDHVESTTEQTEFIVLRDQVAIVAAPAILR
jgi:hypothetical protein